MSGIGVGALLALFGSFLLFGAQEQTGLVFVIFGFTCLFAGAQKQQEQKRLREVQLKKLGAPRPELMDPSFRAADDEARAAAVRNRPDLLVLPVPIPLRPGETACYRVEADLGEVRQMNRLNGGGIMPVDSMPAASDVGELYVTTRRIYFSGTRESRDIPLEEIEMTVPQDGVLQVHRRGRPCPTLFGVPFPRELNAWIERARAEWVPPAIPPAPVTPALVSPATQIAPGIQPAYTAAGVPTFLTCARCGAANGLSANFCQNCAAPLTAGSTPTLHRPGGG